MTYQFLPDLSAEDFDALKADIAERGVLVPVEYDEAGNVLDGHHRIRACEELGIEQWPRIVRRFDSEGDKRTHARQLNLARRHMNQKQRRALIADDLRDRPQRSNRQVAAELGVDHKTVAAAREDLAATGEIPQFDHTVGADGKSRPAHRPKLTELDFGDDGDKATTDAAKNIRSKRAKKRRAARNAKLIEISNADAPLPEDRRYPVLYADPPWQYDHMISDSRAIENHYPTMSIEAICALQVAQLATDDAMLFLWVPPSFLHKGIRVIEAWGFSYLTSMVWDKQTIGMGYYVRQQHEHVLLAHKGTAIVPDPSTLSPSIVSTPRGKHSEKPAVFHEIIERMYPSLPKIELFARDVREGWAAWGNQAQAA